VNLPEDPPLPGTPDLAALAAESAVLRRAVALARWAGAGKRAVTAKGVLRKQDVPAAAAVIGVKCPQALRSAADLPDLHIAWCAAIGAGLLTVAGGKAVGGSALGGWPPDGTGPLEAWLRGLFAVSVGVGGGQRDMGRGFLVLVLALLTVLRDEEVPAARGLLREVLEEAEAYPVCVAFGGDSPVEYPSEDEPQEPEPFNQAAVNTALAGILRS
jgi:hypothetical protein